MTVNLLAFETSGRSGSVAIVQASQRSLEGLESGVIVSEQLDPRWGSAKTLAPCIERMLDKQGLFPRDLDAIAVLRAAISQPQRLDQFLACRHADLPRHVALPPPDHPTGSNLREATGQRE